MTRSIRHALLAASIPALLVLVLLLGALSPALAAESGIRGAGATFPFPIYTRWASDYEHATGVAIGYSPLGSGAGLQQIERKLVDFGGTDVPLPPAELKRLGLVQFPAVIGGVVPVVNVTGIRSGDLKLTGLVLADIYAGKIRKWNDAAIATLNPDLALPSTNITVVHRFDASGTTFLWSEFLSRSSPEWKSKVGASNVLKWPLGVAEVGNEGVASSVQRTRASIGYVEYAYAKQHNLSFASLRNHDGRFVAPSRMAFEAAAMAAQWRSGADLDRLLIDPNGAASWPISGASFVLMRARPEVTARTIAVIEFFDWALRKGQSLATELDYVPLPASAVGLISRRWVEQIRAPEGAAIWPH